jgi:putative tributyrin esterase
VTPRLVTGTAAVLTVLWTTGCASMGAGTTAGTATPAAPTAAVSGAASPEKPVAPPTAVVAAAVIEAATAGLRPVEDRVVESAALGRRMSYRVILPPGYNDSLRRFPTLYLLHGLTGNYRDWESRTNVFRYSRDHEVLIVMPDGEDSWYTDSQGTPAAKFESYIARDLIADVDRTYRTIGTRHGRAIAGLSMGGYGAMKFGLKYPNLFMFAGSFSGALAAGQASFTGGRNEKLAKELLTIYGPAESQTRVDNDLLLVLEKANVTALPFIYVDCGTEDGLLASNRAFVAALQTKKAKYEYRELPGAHTWDYWDRQVAQLLDVLARKLATQ